MEMEDNNYIGNISTIVKFIAMTMAGWLIGWAASKGLDLGVDTATLAEIIGTIILFIAAYIDAEFPNTLKWFHNDKTTPKEQSLILQEVVLNEEYITEDIEGDTEDGC